MNASRRWALGFAAAAAALALAVAGCGSSGSSSTSTPASAVTAAAQGATGISSTQLEARVNLAKCARAHGINLPDPSANGTYTGVSLDGIVKQYGEAKVNEVEQACRQYFVVALPNLALTPAQRTARRQALFQFAACMRAHGVPSFPDPGAGATTSAKIDINPNSPAFKSAVTRCQSVLPAGVKVGGG
jgi:hypothetical protein